jgi:hypothetical protein
MHVAKNPVYYPTASDFQNAWRTYDSSNDLANNEITITGVIGFSDFILEAGLIPLPVELTRFNAWVNKRTVVLDWETASEINNHYFTVEKSLDTRAWTKVSDIMGAGNSTISKTYSYIDNNPWNGLSYYRLKQTDYDGKFTYSSVVSVNMENDMTSRIEMYYDAKNHKLILGNYTRSEIASQLYIYDFQSYLHKSLPVTLLIGTSKIDVSQLENGIYLAVLQTPTGIQKLKFVVLSVK